MSETSDRAIQRPTQWSVRGLLLLVAASAIVLTPISLMVRFGNGHPVSMRDLARVQMGMSKSEVQSILGSPDDETDEYGPLIWTYAAFTWCIVRISFDQDGRVIEIDHDH